MKLITPLGEITVLIDGNELEYSYKKLKSFKSCPDVKDRYAIEIDFLPDGMVHSIACVLSDLDERAKLNVESGEHLECVSVIFEDIKLSVGLEGDDLHMPDGTRISSYDYDIEYLKDGMAYTVLADTVTEKYVFGIAWLSPFCADNEIQTWYAADPTCYKAKD